MRRLQVIALLTLLCAPLHTLAATPPAGSENITASPTQIRPALKPGESTKGEVTVINDGERAYDFKVYTAAYQVSGEDYSQSFVTDQATDAAHWVQVPGQIFHIEPGRSLAIPYTITVPLGVTGGHYATLFYETIPKLGGGSGVQSKERLGVVAYIRVEGAITEKGRIESFDARFFQKGTPVTALLRLSNQGNVHYAADVTFTASDLFNQTKASLHINRQVLPGTTRRFELSWDKAPGFGLFRLGGTVQMLDRTETLPTRYVLILSPSAFLGMLAAYIVLAILGWWWWLGRRRRRQVG